MELVYPGYLGFGVYLIINLLSSARQHAFPFYVELASPGYLSTGGYSIINLHSPARRHNAFPLQGDTRSTHIRALRRRIKLLFK